MVCPPSEEGTVTVDAPPLNTHASVLSCVCRLRADPDITFDDFITQVGAATQPPVEQQRIARVIVQAALCIDCLTSENNPETLWNSDKKLLKILEEAFDPTHPEGLTPTDVQAYKKALKAWKLRKRRKIKIRPTDDLLEHLLFNPTTRVLKVFHQVAWLRAQLGKTRDEPLDFDFERSLRR